MTDQFRPCPARLGVWKLFSPIIVVGFFACAHEDEAGRVSPPHTEFVATLQGTVPELLKRYDVPGAAVALIERGDVAWAAGFGVADRVANEPVNPGTVFNVGSVSKSVAAWGVIKLVEEGRLDLDESAQVYLSRWGLPQSAFDASAVTVRRMLTHTAGLSVHGYLGQVADDRLWTLEESLLGRDTIVDMFRPDSLYDGTGGVRLILPPGTKSRYSGGGYTVTQLLLEELTGERFADYMAREIFQPLDMRHTSYDWPMELRGQTATPYSRGQAAPHRLFTAQAAAGLHTTARDLARLAGALMAQSDVLAPGRGVLTSESVRHMLTAQPHTNPNRWSNAGWGLGVGLDTLSNGTQVVWHGGDNIGWAARWTIIPNSQIGLVVLTNSDAGGGVIQELVCQWLTWAVNDTFTSCSQPWTNS